MMKKSNSTSASLNKQKKPASTTRPRNTMVLSADGGLSLTDDEFNPIEVLYEGSEDE